MGPLTWYVPLMAPIHRRYRTAREPTDELRNRLPEGRNAVLGAVSPDGWATEARLTWQM